MKKYIFISAILFLLLMIPRNTFASSVDLIDKIQIFNGDGSNVTICDENNPTSCVSNMNNTKSFELLWTGSKINANYTINLIFRLYVEKGTIPEATLQDIYVNFLGNSIDVQNLVVVNQRLDNEPEVSETYYDTYRYQLTIAPVNVSSSSSLQSSLGFGFTFPLTGQVSFEVIEFKVSSSLDPPDDPDYTGQLDDINKNQQETNEKLDDISGKLDDLKDDDVNGSKDTAQSFFDDFTTDDFGLSDIITVPLETVKSVTSKTCNPLVLPLPFVNENLTLPCIRTIFEENFSSILNIYQTVTFGLTAYYVIVRIFNLVKDFKNPEHDEIEVMDL